MKRVALALLVVAGTAARADGVDAPRRDREARARYEEATRQYHLGEYDRAIDEYKAAYDLSPAPALLFNIAQAYRAKRDSDSALRYYEAFLRADPQTPERAFVEERMSELRINATSAPSRALAPIVVDRPKNPGLRTAGAVTTGVGAFLVGVGLVFAVDALGRVDGATTDQDRDDLKASQTRAVVFTASGAAAMLTGVVMFYIGSKPVKIAPAVGGGSAGVQVSGAF